MKELIKQIEELKNKVVKTAKILDLKTKKTEIKVLGIEMNEPDFWSSPKAVEVSKKRDRLQEEVGEWEEIQEEVEELLALAKIAEKESDNSVAGEIENKLEALNKKFADLEFHLLFSEKYDSHDAILAIHAGTGGVEAQDWAEMLLRMYLRFTERKGFKVRVVEKKVGREAGIKSATLEIEGHYAYGYLKPEAGVHRLVRISPFDAEKMRHTSFALVEVLPVLGELEEVKIEEKDLKIETFRSSGPGGQGVNTTDSAVRIIHLPTKITVVCQNERSQHQNKEFALKMLRGKLHKLYLEEREKEKRQIKGEYAESSWGNQIRSYVLQPYKMVKDHRTKYEVKEVEKVLDGEIEGFIEAFLKRKK